MSESHHGRRAYQLATSVWVTRCDRREISSSTVSSDRYEMELKKHLSYHHILRHTKTKWHYSEGRN